MGLNAVTLAVGKKYTDKKIKELLGDAPEELDSLKEVAEALKVYGTPSVTSEDNGKFLCVVDGAWAATDVPEAEASDF